MRKLAVILLALQLAACTTTQVQQIETFIGQVQSATAAACKFIPTVSTIISLVNTGIGQVVGVIAAAVCNAVPPPTSARFKALPRVGARAGAAGTVNGVTINGWRTN